MIFGEIEGSFSDACYKAIEFGKPEIIRPDWKKVFGRTRSQKYQENHVSSASQEDHAILRVRVTTQGKRTVSSAPGEERDRLRCLPIAHGGLRPADTADRRRDEAATGPGEAHFKATPRAQPPDLPLTPA